MIDFKDSKPFISFSFEDRYETYIPYVLSFVRTEGVWIEFGVSSGETTKKYVSYMMENQKPLFGFDWFYGLPESWSKHDVGAFTQNGVIPIIDGCEIIVGLFENTLPNFINNLKKNISVLIIDCDIYSSTKTIFDNCKNHIEIGTVIIFDEIHNGDGINNEWEENEYKAFMEFVYQYGVEFEWIAHIENGEQAACIITKI